MLKKGKNDQKLEIERNLSGGKLRKPKDKPMEPSSTSISGPYWESLRDTLTTLKLQLEL